MDDPTNRSNSLSPARKKRSYNLQRNQSTKFPLAFLFHVLAAYFLLLPIPWILGEQAKNEATDPKNVYLQSGEYMLLKNVGFDISINFLLGIETHIEIIVSEIRHAKLGQITRMK
ncbi:hypothetical protein ACTXT7_009054 [Hymenolepis weldensis]